MLYVERSEYLSAMRRTLDACEAARVAPAKAGQRSDDLGR
jgi:hypothetical protein